MTTAPEDSPQPEDESPLSLGRRLWRYQAERFPLMEHGPLILAFAGAAVGVSALLRGDLDAPTWGGFLAAAVVMLGLFFQLRVSDEVKDAAVDAATRPERPVPRGLVSLRLLVTLALVLLPVQALVAGVRAPVLLLPLALVWCWMALMAVEFGLGAWLRARPVLYLVTHMMVMPLIDLFATANDWLVAGGGLPAGLIWFLVLSFFNGVVLEIGRKTWAPDQERPGVESYSSTWGRSVALLVWALALLAALGCAWQVAVHTGFLNYLYRGLLPLAVLCLGAAVWFWRVGDARRAGWLQEASGLWVLLCYLALGGLPLICRSCA